MFRFRAVCNCVYGAVARVVYSRMVPNLTKPQTGRLNKSPHTVHAIANLHRRLDKEDSYDKNKSNRSHRSYAGPCPDAFFERKDDCAGAGAAATDQPRAQSGP